VDPENVTACVVNVDPGGTTRENTVNAPRTAVSVPNSDVNV
jgi:hypothetical protein